MRSRGRFNDPAMWLMALTVAAIVAIQLAFNAFDWRAAGWVVLAVVAAVLVGKYVDIWRGHYLAREENRRGLKRDLEDIEDLRRKVERLKG